MFSRFFHRASSDSESDQSDPPESDQSTHPNHPTATSSSEETPPDPILDLDSEDAQHAAFRTTSYFLSKLLTRSLGTGPNFNGIPAMQRTQLKILNAFATIAVIDSEVVSVVANTSWQPTLQLIAAAEGHEPVPAAEGCRPVPSVEGHEPVTAPEATNQSPNFVLKLADLLCQKFQVIFTKNPRDVASRKDTASKPEHTDPDDPTTPTTPTIVDVHPPVGVSESDLPDLVKKCKL